MNRRAICLFLILVVCLALQTNAQQGLDSTVQYKSNGLHKRNVAGGLTYLKPLSAPSFNPSNKQNLPAVNDPLPANFYSTNLGFFCSKEIQLEKVTRIPFRFRLGSVQYTDAMEGKRRF